MSLESMTGYGSARKPCGESLEVLVEARSVNHRSVQVHISPRELPLSLTARMEEQARSRFTRGRIEVRVSVAAAGDAAAGAASCLDINLARALAEASASLARELGIEEDMTSSRLLRFPGVVCAGPAQAVPPGMLDDPGFAEALLEILSSALDSLAESRAREGGVLAGDLARSLESVLSGIEDIRQGEAQRAGARAARLRARMEEMLEGASRAADPDGTRLMQEAAMLSMRADVTEECVRTEAHVRECLDLLGGEEAAPGMRLQFLLQEMQRELNTMGSKLDEVETTSAVVGMKATVASMKEQAANIE
ncbi:DUF1732 domain-containing protein [Candidatus Fermentibacterales bacterium]|nr:DUF1732 domain-containing protein [Candidatus Fermentibacterales bacterium]